MKTNTISRRLTFALCLVTFFALAPISVQAGIGTGKATVKHLRGAVHYSVAQGVWIPLKQSSNLSPGTLIKTAPDSSVTLFFKENRGTLTVNPNSILRLTKLNSAQTGLELVSEAELDLIEGSVAGVQEKTSALSAFKINGFAVPGGNFYQIDSKGSSELKKTQPSFDPISTKTRSSDLIARVEQPAEKPNSEHGNNGVGNGEDPAPPGNPNPNDGPGTGPGNPGNGRPERP